MVKSRILKQNNKAYLELPEGLGDEDEIEVFQLKEGYYLLSRATDSRTTINEIEKSVLRKLNEIRFENRTPEHVNKVMTETEKLILKELGKRGFVNIFKGKKYRNGVFSISDKVYPLLREKGTSVAKTAAPQKAPAGPLGILQTRGFLILNDRNEATRISQKLSQEIKRGEIFGTKGFDGKFYAVAKPYLEDSQKKINAVLNGDMDADSIAKSTKLDLEGCTAVLRLMSENGEILEKKKGLFAPI